MTYAEKLCQHVLFNPDLKNLQRRAQKHLAVQMFLWKTTSESKGGWGGGLQRVGGGVGGGGTAMLPGSACVFQALAGVLSAALRATHVALARADDNTSEPS